MSRTKEHPRRKPASERRPNFDYTAIASSGVGGRLTKALGLPTPARLRRHEFGDPVIDGVVVIDGYAEALVADYLRGRLGSLGIPLADAAPNPPGVASVAAVIVDMTSMTGPEHLEIMRAIIAPALRSLAPGGRVIALVRPPEESSSVPMSAARQGVYGIIRSLAKELKGGATANAIEIADLADYAVDSSVRFLLSGRSAYVSGQVIRVATPVGPLVEPDDWDHPLAGSVAVVTGAAQGIGAAVARTLGRDGATVICVDLPEARATLTDLAEEIDGSALPLSITDHDAGPRIAAHCQELHGGLDIVAHVAGITRDRLLMNLDADWWQEVLEVNLVSVLRMNDALVPALRNGGHMVHMSSTTGFAGNRGQTNYAASKAGIIGLTAALARDATVRGKQVTVNAVAPGYIATAMTAQTPVVAREVGKLLNSLQQPGRPEDVAEVISYLCWPNSRGVTGETLRVCGQLMVGA